MTYAHTLAARDSRVIRDPTARFVLLAICMRTNRDGQTWAALSTFAKDTSSSVPTVRRAIRRLVDAGLLVVIHRPGTPSILTLTPIICDVNPFQPKRGKLKGSYKEVSVAIAAEGKGASAPLRARGHPANCRCHGDGVIVAATGVFPCSASWSHDGSAG